ncbi:MAG: two pore domain potassium channel family protein [Gammaproteobacteria bacterium]|nr:two pore domain potassium channel family protein [Gammaproteobacteria bacterium]
MVHRLRRYRRFSIFVKDIWAHTPFVRMVLLLIALWLVSAAAIYLAERGVPGASITGLGDALYWGVAAFSTAGIADTPRSGLALAIGGVWIVVGSMLFFGTIVATITTYFMRPMQRPGKRIIDTIEYNLEQLNELTIDELDLLKETVDTLIVHVERLKIKQANQRASGQSSQ